MIKPSESKTIWVACRMVYSAIALFYIMLKSKTVAHEPKSLMYNLGKQSEQFLLRIGKFLPKEAEFLFMEKPLNDEGVMPVANIVYEMYELNDEELEELEGVIVEFCKTKRLAKKEFSEDILKNTI